MQKHPIIAFKEQLDLRMAQFKRALPAHIPAERFTRVVLTAVQNNPDLLNADRQSLWNACMRAAEDGLLPDGREGAIVIYNRKIRENGGERWIKKAQWMPMVFGIIKKIRNSGQLAMITARVVYAGDRYRYWMDEQGEHILYEPSETPDKNVVRLVFAAARTKDGELLVEPLTPDEIEKIRSVSRAKDDGPWVDWWEEMAKKSAIRRLSKRLPMSADLDDLVRRDDDLYFVEERQVQSLPQSPPAKNTLDAFAGVAAEAEPVEQPANESAPLAAATPTAAQDDGLDIPASLRRPPLEAQLFAELQQITTVADCLRFAMDIGKHRAALGEAAFQRINTALIQQQAKLHREQNGGESGGQPARGGKKQKASAPAPAQPAEPSVADFYEA
jgi:phage RecT family recombinase